MGGAGVLGEAPGEAWAREDELEAFVVGRGPDEAAGREHVDVVAVEVDQAGDDAEIVGRLPGTEAMAGDPQALGGVVVEVAVPAGGDGEIDAEALADLAQPARLDVALVEGAGQIDPGRGVDKRGAEARRDEERGIDRRRRHAEGYRLIEDREPKAVAAELGEFGDRGDRLLEHPRLRSRGKLPPCRRLKLLPRLPRRRQVVEEERLLEILGIADRGQADPTGDELLHRRQRHRDVDRAGLVVDRRRKRRRRRERERERVVGRDRRCCHDKHEKHDKHDERGEAQPCGDVTVQVRVSGRGAGQ